MVEEKRLAVSGLSKILCVSLISLFTFHFSICEAQEVLLPLQTRPLPPIQTVKQSGNQAITLPFFDDFSSPTVTTQNFQFSILNFQFSDGARLLPPTVGVATLDALDANGNLYPDASTSIFPADTLVSLPIRLDGLTPADSLVFSFFYLPGGGEGNLWERVGDAPDPQDSLFLEFYRPSDSTWTVVWSRGGVTVDSLVAATGLHWQYVAIPVTDSACFDSLFQFRFRNFCSLTSNSMPGLAGNCDFWHLDYILLDTARSSAATPVFHDVAFVDPAPSALTHYRAMPARQYQPSDMADHFDMTITNLFNSTLATQYAYAVVDTSGDTLYRYDGGYENAPPFLPGERYQSAAAHAHPPINFTFPLSSSLTPLTSFTILHAIREGTTGDDYAASDTVRFQQLFDNYYAYDDGTAENGYGLTSTAQHVFLAYRFDLNTPDTLTALDLFFNRTFDGENEQVPFLITVWLNEDGRPGQVLYKDQSRRRPFTGTHSSSQALSQSDNFERYVLERPVVVDGSIFVGFEQTNNYYINLGFDRSYNTADRIYYLTGTEWQQSILSGSLMLRPCFGASATVGIDPVSIFNSQFSIYPNPASDHVTIEGLPAGTRIELYDASGRLRLSTFNFQLSTFNYPEGIYLLRAIAPDGTSHTEKLLIRK